MTTLPSMSCPSDGTFYACGDGSRFVGCCTANPCGSNGCPAGNLKATGMTASQYGQIPDEDCDSTGAQFYSCNTTTPTFWGCCKSNPCQSSGCPVGSLVGASLFNDGQAVPYLQAYNSSFAGGGNAVTSSSASEGGAATQTSSPSSTASAALTAAPQGQSSSTNIGAIVGGAVGGFAVLAVLIFGIILLLRRRSRSKTSTQPNNIEEQPSAAAASSPCLTRPQASEMKHQDHQGAHTLSPASPHSQSPQSASPYPNSPQTAYSPAPPSYWDERRARHISHYELQGSMGGQELESGQMYNPYRQGQGQVMGARRM